MARTWDAASAMAGPADAGSLRSGAESVFCRDAACVQNSLPLPLPLPLLAPALALVDSTALDEEEADESSLPLHAVSRTAAATPASPVRHRVRVRRMRAG